MLNRQKVRYQSNSNPWNQSQVMMIPANCQFNHDVAIRCQSRSLILFQFQKTWLFSVFSRYFGLSDVWNRSKSRKKITGPRTKRLKLIADAETNLENRPLPWYPYVIMDRSQLGQSSVRTSDDHVQDLWFLKVWNKFQSK